LNSGPSVPQIDAIKEEMAKIYRKVEDLEASIQ